MAGSERIDDIIDLQSAQQQITKLLEMLSSVDDKIKQVGKITLNYTQVGTGSAEIRKQTDELIKANTDMVNMQKALAEQVVKAKSAQDMFGRSVEENTQHLLRLKTSMDSYKKSLADDALLLKEGTITRAEYNKRIAESSAKVSEYKLKSSELTSVLKMQQKQQMAVTGSMDEMSQRLNLMKNSYRALSEEQRKSASGMALQKEISTLDASLKSANAALGDHQRNVGNYGSAIQGFASKAWGGLRTLANILPGLGIAGIFGAVGTAIYEVIKALDLFSTKLDMSKIHSQDVVDMNKESAKSYADQSVKLTILKERFLEAGASAQQKKNVMNELNKEFSDYGVNLKNTSETEDFLVNKTPAFLLMLDTKAKATATFSLATEHYKKALEAQAKADAEYTGVGEKFISLAKAKFSSFRNLIAGSMDPGLIVQASINLKNLADKNRKTEIDEETAKYRDLLKLGFDFQKKYDEMQRRTGMTPTGKAQNILVSKPIDFSEDQRKTDDSLIKAQIEGQKEVLNTRLFFLNQIMGNEDKSFKERELALIESIEIQKQLVDLQSQSELTGIKSKLTEIDKLNDAGGKKAIQAQLDQVYHTETIEESKRTAVQKTLLNKKDDLAKQMRLLIEEEALRKQGGNLVKQAEDKKSEIASKGVLDRIKLAMDESTKLAKREGVIVDTKAIDTELEKLKELHDEYRKGKRTLEDYNHQKEILKDTVLLESLKQHGAILMEQRKNYVKYGKDTTDVDKQIADNTKKQQELSLKLDDETISAKWAKNKKITDNIISYTREATSIISEIMNNRFSEEKNAIQDIENAQQQSYAKDVENIEKSSASEQDKANKLKILESRRQAQKEANAREQKKIDIEKAKFDKAQTILNIILNTASAIMAAVALSPFTGGAPGSIIAGAIGAAQLAVAVSAPLPKYAKGRNGGPAEWALTDEKGPELYLEPDGRAYMGNDRPTMRFLQAGTKIIPADQINNYSTLRMLAQLSGPTGPDATGKKIDELKDIVAWQTNKLASAYGDRKAPVVNIINQGQWNDYINRSVKN